MEAGSAFECWAGEHRQPVGLAPGGTCPLKTHPLENPSSSLPPLLLSTICVSSFTRKEDKLPVWVTRWSMR